MHDLPAVRGAAPVGAALPFTIRRSSDVIGPGSIRTTTEIVQGLLRLGPEALTVQWRRERRVDLIGREIRTDSAFEEVREVRVPIDAIVGAHAAPRGMLWWRRVVVTVLAADLRAFESLAGGEGFHLEHPAQLRLVVRPADRLIAEEFCADLALALAEHGRGGRALPAP